jgi:hypothetical protein
MSATYSFWISATSVPGRMGLLITTYLVLTNMSAGATPFKAQVFTAMDAWLYGCKLLNIGALFEYAFLLRMIKVASIKGLVNMIVLAF